MTSLGTATSTATATAAPPAPSPPVPINITLQPNTPYVFSLTVGGVTYTVNAMLGASASGGVNLAMDTGSILTTDAGSQIQED